MPFGSRTYRAVIDSHVVTRPRQMHLPTVFFSKAGGIRCELKILLSNIRSRFCGKRTRMGSDLAFESVSLLALKQCLPLIVSNGTELLIKNRLVELDEHHHDDIPFDANYVLLRSFTELKNHYNNVPEARATPVIFMFFDGVSFVLLLITEVLNHQREFGESACSMFDTVFLYFDLSVSVGDHVSNPYGFLLNDAADAQLHTISTVVADILKKVGFMAKRIRGVYIDDLPFQQHNQSGAIVRCLQSIMRNHPKVERIDLLLYTSLVMKGFV